jgi:hypothetical protein
VRDAECLDFDDQELDLVTCALAVFFLPRPDRAMAEFRRVLRTVLGLRAAATTRSSSHRTGTRASPPRIARNVRWRPTTGRGCCPATRVI